MGVVGTSCHVVYVASVAPFITRQTHNTSPHQGTVMRVGRNLTLLYWLRNDHRVHLLQNREWLARSSIYINDSWGHGLKKPCMRTRILQGQEGPGSIMLEVAPNKNTHQQSIPLTVAIKKAKFVLCAVHVCIALLPQVELGQCFARRPC